MSKVSSSVYFICGNDDFLVNEAGEKVFRKLSGGGDSGAMGHDVIDGRAGNVGEVEGMMREFYGLTQTMSLFGEKKVVWLKSLNALSDSVTARAAGTIEQMEGLLEALGGLSESVKVVITATPVDRRTKLFKAFSKVGEYKFIEAQGTAEGSGALVERFCKESGLKMTPGAKRLIGEKVGHGARILMQELEKLRTYQAEALDQAIDEDVVHSMVPQYGEGDFFEVVDAFYSKNIGWTIQALKRHFATQKEGRPLLAAFQNRNRLLIQLSALASGGISLNKNNIDQVREQAGFAQGKKSAYNVFTQNPWYLGKLMQGARGFKSGELVDLQQDLIKVFQGLIERPNDHGGVFMNLALKYFG